MTRRFALLDRDGTVIVERNYLASPEGVELLPRAAEGMARLAELGLGLAMVTNQSGLGRGFFDQAAVTAVHERLRALLAPSGVSLDGIYVCPHVEEDRCDCRKPKPGLALQAATELGFALPDCFVVGDKSCDIDLGRAIGATTILVRTGYGHSMPPEVQARAHFVVADLGEAADVIARLLAK